jgi:hypothetical protein
MDNSKLNQKLQNVPPKLIPEIMDFIDFLLNKYGSTSKSKSEFKFHWSGGLSDISKQYSSVELQHKSMEWR